MQQRETTIRFISPFDGYLHKFLNEKRALGYKYKRETYLLGELDRFLNANTHDNAGLSRELVLAWTQKRPHERERTQCSRIHIVKQFSEFLARQGVSTYIPDGTLTPKKIMAFTPYIFSEAEIRSLLCAADNLKQRAVSPRRHLVIPLMFRMLYGCGLRLGEACGIRIRDVDLELGVLAICEAKFGKDRLVPMARPLTEKMCHYAQAELRLCGPDEFFFPAPDGGPYNIGSIYGTYRRLLWQCGISHGGRGTGPRLHDLRHTFAVHCLKRWVRQGVDLYAAMPVLSEYLGHSTLDGTQRYLRLTADLYPDIIAAVEQHFGNIIPERSN